MKAAAPIVRSQLFSPGQRIAVAVSGGADSVALLLRLLEERARLGIVLSVAHVNHGIREASGEDADFVAALAARHNLPFHFHTTDAPAAAAERHETLEEAARHLRYGFFRALLEAGTIDAVATAHTLDDQAETVLMRMIRGTGMKGLGGIHPRIAIEDDDGEICGEIMRPLLGFRRCELERYLREIGQTWRDDSTNLDAKFTRNRLRQRLLPLLEKEFNPAVAESLAELAEIARGEEDYWENEIAGWMGTAVHWFEPEWARTTSKSADLVQISSANALQGQNPRFSQNQGEVGRPALSENALRSRIDSAPWLVMNASVSRAWFLGEPVAVQRRLVKAIGEHAHIPLEFKHVEEILEFAEAGKTNRELSMPHGWKVQCNADELIFLPPDLREPAPERDYEYSLAVPGRVTVHEIGSTIDARIVRASEDAAYNPDHLLDAESLPGPLRVRNWRPGDRFWPAHTKSPRKIKELLQDRHIAEPQRKLWPVVLSGDEVVWVRGFPCPAKFRARPGHDAIMIAEHSAADELKRTS
jgi:tRNA(Ile)-lysidine synthase